MCGICGVLGRHADNREIRRLLDAIKHRGPDDEGTFQTGDVFLGHRRLAILDVSPAGHQPMVSDGCWLVFNGEIYNYIELRQELSALGHDFKTDTDTEVLLHAWLEWKEKAFSRLRGMWALAIFDRQENKVILCRDRLGIKPLYYTVLDKALLFSSEIPGLLPGMPETAPNDDMVIRYLMLGITEHKNETFYRDIWQVEPGTYLRYDLTTRQYDIVRYYVLEEHLPLLGETDYAASYDETVRIHLRSDVRVGCCLSGGLDSSTLAATAARIYEEEKGEAMYAITAKSEDKGNDESNFAAIVAEYAGLNWHLSYPSYEDFVAKHEAMLKIQAEPVGGPSVFMQYCVMEEACKKGCKVMLDGQGGDETLLGYERYYITYLWELLHNHEYGKFCDMYRQIAANSKLTLMSLFKYFCYFSFDVVRRLFLEKRCDFVKKGYRQKFFAEEFTDMGKGKDLQRLQIEEICKGHLSTLLRYEDRNSMAWSLESRVPYVDHILVEKAVALDGGDKIKYGWTKYILRRICEKVLPKEIAWRKNKYGFNAPENIWMDKYQEVMQQEVEKSSLVKKYFNSIPKMEDLPVRLRWIVYNLAVWERQYLHS